MQRGRVPPQAGTMRGLYGRCNRDGERLSPLPVVRPVSNLAHCGFVANGAAVVDSQDKCPEQIPHGEGFKSV